MTIFSICKLLIANFYLGLQLLIWLYKQDKQISKEENKPKNQHKVALGKCFSLLQLANSMKDKSYETYRQTTEQ